MTVNDGSQDGIPPERALKTILGGEPAPTPDDGLSRQQMMERLLAKDDNINGYNEHAEVMAKYILMAYRERPELQACPIECILKQPVNWSNPEVLVPGLSDTLKAEVYTDPSHPFRQALSEATGFSWGWAFNAARYALNLPPQPNPAIIEI